MRKKVLFLLAVACMLLALMDCKREPKVTKTTSDPNDTLYQGTKFAIESLPIYPEIALEFPSIKNPYKDSLTVEGILLGRRLFYDKHLSINGQMACASCHLLSHSFADSIPLANNVFGVNKRKAPRLVNLAWEPVLFWDGRQPTISAQAQDAAHNELGINVAMADSFLQRDTVYARLFRKAFGRPGMVTESNIYLAIQEFLLTVISVNSRFDSLMRQQVAFTADESDAFYNLFITETGECFHCHAFGNNYLMADYGSGETFRNNGLQVASAIGDFQDPGRGGITGVSTDYGLFKNPSLRNIALGGPYMHDGRFKTLTQVINFYSDSLNLTPNYDAVIAKHMDTLNGTHLLTGGLHLTQQQKNEMLVLLNDLTDNSFINNPAYKSPF